MGFFVGAMFMLGIVAMFQFLLMRYPTISLVVQGDFVVLAPFTRP